MGCLTGPAIPTYRSGNVGVHFHAHCIHSYGVGAGDGRAEALANAVELYYTHQVLLLDLQHASSRFTSYNRGQISQG